MQIRPHRKLSIIGMSETNGADLPEIMRILTKIGEESILRADLLEQIPHIAAQAVECSIRVEGLKNVVSEYLIPLVVRNLGYSDTAVDKAAHVTLINLIEHGYINKQQAEIQVCPAILALSKDETSADINTGAITLMSKLAPLLGRDITERVFLKRFIDLCASPMFYVRKVCAAHFGEFGAVLGKDAFENILLLEDDCRWVRMSAYQALGPFISTFANPTITNVGYNKGGDLVLLNGEGSEFLINCAPLSLTERFNMNNEKEEVDMNPLNSDMDNMSNSETSELEDKGEWYFEGMLKIQEMLDTVIPNGELPVETVEDDLKEKMENLKLGVDKENAEHSGISKNEPSKSCVNASDTATTNNDSNKVKSDDCDEKVIFAGGPFDHFQDDLRLFNSHNYWYVSPDLPLDPFVVANGQCASTVDGSADVASHLEKLYSTINLSDSLNVTGNEYDSTISLEKDSLCEEDNDTNLADTTVALQPAQDVVPQPLIDHYVLMTDPSLSVKIDNEMTYHCAYSLPAVASTLGSNNWHLLKNTVEALAGDMQYKVRKTVASGLHELASILGPEEATVNLTPLFDGFIKDLDEVRIGVLQHLAPFLNMINPAKRQTYIPKLVEFLQTDNEWNWRFREELAVQLFDAVELFKPADMAKHLGVIAMILLCDKVAVVRGMAISLLTKIVKNTSPEPGLTSCLLVKLAENFAHSKKWKKRQTFCLLCTELLVEKALPAEQFASEIMPHLLDLSWDPVPNIRLVVARCISKNIITNEYFADPCNEHYENLETVLRRLQADRDVDVRQSAV
ncbi:hypothetical protein JTB14_005944 [Gonioctena quinquepunctata]|nr:hypothetical protein JTB14_005944 [Gonioctena quinquepunctata]